MDPRGLLAAIGSLVVALSNVACSGQCHSPDENSPASAYTRGTVANGTYCSSSAHGGLLHFPGGQRYDLYHHLGYEPLVVLMYWSFHPNGVGTDSTEGFGGLTTASGNSAEIELKNDQFIRVRNDSCAEFWLEVCAFGDPRVPDGGAPADAGSD